jgi:hypothetical protein
VKINHAREGGQMVRLLDEGGKDEIKTTVVVGGWWSDRRSWKSIGIQEPVTDHQQPLH